MKRLLIMLVIILIGCSFYPEGSVFRQTLRSVDGDRFGFEVPVE